jgi:hypothetical protein
MGKTKFSSKPCRGCNEVFQPTRKWQDFCSSRCRVESWKEKNRHAAVSFTGRIVALEEANSDLERRVKALESGR